ncbi:unnamed protein product [Rotaria sordida]|uniref:Uncharacterized protein n=1 Tax=Rotaria sordida TaxID=392033 RepID=A0A814TJF3_9BILA|nr:unnamed protein product [Rotaria sordida]CAF1409609.1 unnamed protein product [Rotaria sordida]
MASSSTKKVFSLLSCDWIGFDLDHTLIRYRLFDLHKLIYESMREYLIDTYEYNCDFLPISYNDHFSVKGLIYDSFNGNLIQLNSNGLVNISLHGVNRHLTSEQIKEIYPNALKDIEEDTSKRFCETRPERRSEYLFYDFNRGNYFSSLRLNPDKYIYKRLDVPQWLEKLKKLNKKLFLATNSSFNNTDLLTRYAFGDDWKDLFDLIIVVCKKPSFFSNSKKRSFHRFIDENTTIPVNNEDIIKDFNKNYIYSFGSSEDLHFIMSQISKKDPLVIYFGDHIKSDINALKCYTNWLAGVVIEELEFDSPPIIIHRTSHHLSNRLSINDQSYNKGNRSKYFSSFFTSPTDSFIFDDDNTNRTKSEQTEPDAVLPSLTSYWYAYITKHAHLSLSCLSVLANHFDLDHQFEHDQQTQHFVIMHQNNK